MHQAEGGEDIQITRHGKPVAVIVSLDRYQQAFGNSKGIHHTMMRWRKAHPATEGFTDTELQAMHSKEAHEARPSVWEN